jgi:uncharacterized protein
VTLLRRFSAITCMMAIAGCARNEAVIPASDSNPPSSNHHAIVVGAGLAGLSAAIEMGRAGATVLVIDMNSVFGGHGIQTGGVAIVNSPMQEALGYHDTPEQAYRDWLSWTIEPNREWMRYYVTHSRTEIYDFLLPLGVVFDRINASHGNSIPRFHMTQRRGLNLVRPLFHEALRHTNVDFRWNLQATRPLLEHGRIVGLEARDLRTRQLVTLKSEAVVLATGGFQRNLGKIKEHWPADDPLPERILTGSGKFSLGIGHDLAQAAGAALMTPDRQYNSYSAIPDPRDSSGTLGLTASNPRSVWVNATAHRFVNPNGFDKDVYAKVLAQPGGTYWAIFDESAKADFRVGNSDWADRPILAAQVLADPKLVKSAATIEELARLSGLPAAALAATIQRYNEMIEKGEDADFGSFSSSSTQAPTAIVTPPFYAVQFYPMAHKNTGGVAIDLNAQVLDRNSAPIPGLYAAGEITGSAGINGLAGLDGTFTGPAILIGRVAGRSVAAQLRKSPSWNAVGPGTSTLPAADATPNAEGASWSPSMDATILTELVRTPRDGYWHFEQVHKSVLRRQYACTQCHSALVPQQTLHERSSWRAQTGTCDHCHLGPESR